MPRVRVATQRRDIAEYAVEVEEEIPRETVRTGQLRGTTGRVDHTLPDHVDAGQVARLRAVADDGTVAGGVAEQVAVNDVEKRGRVACRAVICPEVGFAAVVDDDGQATELANGQTFASIQE